MIAPVVEAIVERATAETAGSRNAWSRHASIRQKHHIITHFYRVERPISPAIETA
jgi:hypothetical protein